MDSLDISWPSYVLSAQKWLSTYVTVDSQVVIKLMVSVFVSTVVNTLLHLNSIVSDWIYRLCSRAYKFASQLLHTGTRGRVSPLP